MKMLLKVVGAIVVCLILLLVVLRITGFGPHGSTPGLWLSGNLVAAPVADWSFTEKYPTVEIQTQTWYGIPHSVTTACMTYQGQFYVGSMYSAGMQYPHGRSWNENVARDPHVRIKIGNNLYDCTLVHITDPDVVTAVLQAQSEKYRGMRVPAGGSLQLFHVVQNGAPATASGD
jgi:hypothetical protein